MYKAASEPYPTQIYDIASDKDEEMEEYSKSEAAKIQIENDKKLEKKLTAVEMGKVSVEGAHQATIPSLLATSKRDKRRAKRTTAADDACPQPVGRHRLLIYPRPLLLVSSLIDH